MICNQKAAVQKGLCEHRAMAVLQLLDGPLHGGGNDRLLISVLEALGLRTTRVEMHELLDFLEREGAIAMSKHDGLNVIELRNHGHEIATGLVVVEGIEKPTPEATY